MKFEIEFRSVGYKIRAKLNTKPEEKKIEKKRFFNQIFQKENNFRRPVGRFLTTRAIA